MEPDWSATDVNKIKDDVIPRIIKCYFGSGLEKDSSIGKDLFLYRDPNTEDRLIMKWWDGATDDENAQFESLYRELSYRNISFGLVVSLSSTPFRTKKDGDGRVISLFGKQQLNAIARLNYYQLSGSLQYRNRFPIAGSADGAGALYLGNRTILWSDVVEFVQESTNIANRINVDPVLIRRMVITLVDYALSSDRNRRRVKVGADGWYFAYRNRDDAVYDALRGHSSVTNYVSSVFGNSRLKLICSLSDSPHTYVDEGGPIDDGSILAFKVLAHHNPHGSHQHSDIRYAFRQPPATPPTGWNQCCNISLNYFGTVTIYRPP